MILGASATAAVADDKLVDVGKSEYDAACAVCHGSKGKGNGPFVEQLASRVPDLRSSPATTRECSLSTTSIR
jgi:mono/diheme cytochrome c family protein